MCCLCLVCLFLLSHFGVSVFRRDCRLMYEYVETCWADVGRQHGVLKLVLGGVSELESSLAFSRFDYRPVHSLLYNEVKNLP